MVSEGTYIAIIYPLISVLAIIAAFFALKTLAKIRKQKKEKGLRKALLIVFSLLAIGAVFWAIGECTYSALAFVNGERPTVGIADIFWIAGYLFIIPTFAFFSFFMWKQHKGERNHLIISAPPVILSIVSYILITRLIGPSEAPNSLIAIVSLSYPVLDMIAAVLALSCCVFFKGVKKVQVPLSLLAASILVVFIADTMYIPIMFFNVYGVWGMIADFLYVPQYLLMIIAFYNLSKTNTKRGE